ncbi:hypothetical protein GCM10023187_51750 [Nibrella viscosa]|uniref:Transposase n=1 Tax=Nibrella viscosa TaxID=1084524 RepID=A0ABP8KYY4_9BACT
MPTGSVSGIGAPKRQDFLERAPSLFERSSEPQETVDVERLFAKIGRLELENEWLKKSLKNRTAERLS